MENEVFSNMKREALPQGVWGRSPQQAKKGRRPGGIYAFFGHWISNVYLADHRKSIHSTNSNTNTNKHTHKKKEKNINIKKIIITTILTTTVTACSTTKQRDKKLIESLQLQNSVIRSIKHERSKTNINIKVNESEVLKESESKLDRALETISKSNEVVINKLKGTNKKECSCGKIQRENNRKYE